MKKLIICAICAICGFTTANAQAKFGHVNTEEIMQAMPETAKMRADMEALQKQYDEEEKGLIAEYQKKIEEYQAKEKDLPDNIKQRRVQEINEMEQKIQQARQDNAQAFQKAYTDRLEPIQKKVLNAINTVGKEGGFVYIIQQNSLPYISTTLSTDVTAQVKAKLGLK